MRNIITTLLLILVLTSLNFCSRSKESTSPSPVIHPQLANLKRPDIILNEIAKGEFHNGNFSFISHQDYNNKSKNWSFSAFENSNKIKSIVFTEPHYSHCETTELTYYYNNAKLIDKIISIRKNICLEFEAKSIYTYNYEEGVLVSIIGKNYYSDKKFTDINTHICENYFSYFRNGKIAEVYSNFRPADQPLSGYQKKSYTYDNAGNITEAVREEYNPPGTGQKYTYEYDKNLNPMKGVYIISSELAGLPGFGYESTLGPNFLSKNCLISVKIEYLHINAPPQIKYFTSQTDNGKVVSFGSEVNDQYWFRNIVTY